MEIDKEFIDKNGLNEDQAKAITELYDTTLADAKKKIEDEYSGKANENAQKILSGAADAVAKETGVQRNDGEKIADYIGRAYASGLEDRTSSLAEKEKEIETKLKEIQEKGGANEHLIKELETLKQEKDDMLKKYADFDDLKEKAEKADEYSNELSGLKLQVAFNDVKPVFPKEVNEYESRAKWDEFKKEILEKNTIELVDGEPMAIDKENPHKTTKLKDLVEKNETIQELLKGRQQDGSGGKQTSKVEIDGLPFTLPENAQTSDRAKAIDEYLISQGIQKHEDKYAQEFKKYNDIILKAQQKA